MRRAASIGAWFVLAWGCGRGTAGDEPIPIVEIDMCSPAPDCDDGVECTEDRAVAQGDCTFECLHVPRCESGDGCCEACGTDDEDCNAECGNGVVEFGETCDGDCPQSAADCHTADCSIARLVGSPDDCTAECLAVEAVEDRCVDSDGCCPELCAAEYDDDCASAAGTFGEPCGSVQQCVATNDAEPLCAWADWAPKPSPATCTQTCARAADCPTGTFCFDGRCAADCLNDAQCPDEWYCGRGDAAEPLRCLFAPWHPRGAATGSACRSNEECLGANIYYPGICLDEATWGFPDGYCSQGWGCIGSAGPPCRDDNVCISDLCWDRCTSDADCRAGYSCGDYFGANIDICAPTTGDRIGEPCADDSECAGGHYPALCAYPEAGGYCSTGCQNNGDCPGDAYCSNIKICRDHCASDADCRAGFTCARDGDGQRSCLAIRSGSASLGEPCAKDADCSGYGRAAECIRNGLLRDGYCVVDDCDADADCPAGGVCEGFTCFAGCETDADCAPNTVCTPLDDTRNICTAGGHGGGAIGDVCTRHDDCDGVCIQDVDLFEGMCSTVCDSQGACPTGTTCVFAPSGGYGICASSCTNRGLSCGRDDLSCRDWDGNGRPECMPRGLTDAATGDPCTGLWECSGIEALCLHGFDNGYCSGYCRNDDDCPGDGICVADGNGYKFCWEQCETTTDCRPPQYCTEVSPGVKVCY